MQSLDLPSDHVSALVDVGDAIHEALNTGQTLTHDGLGVVTVVQILCHLSYNKLLIFIYN